MSRGKGPRNYEKTSERCLVEGASRSWVDVEERQGACAQEKDNAPQEHDVPQGHV